MRPTVAESSCPAVLFITSWHRHLVAAAILMSWWALVLRDQLPTLLVLLAVIAATGWIVRHRPGIAVAVAIAAGTVCALVVAVITVLDKLPGSTDAAAVLVGYAVAGPAPTLTAWSLRPAVISRHRAALLGSAIHLASAALAAVIVDPIAATLMPITVITVCSAIWLANHRRRSALTGPVNEIGDGWTDLGVRDPGGKIPATRLLLGRGHGIAAWPCPTDTPGRRQMVAAIQRAALVADHIGLPTHRVQPVLLGPVKGLPRRTLVSTTDLAAVVVVARPDQLISLTAAAPRRNLFTGRRSRRLAATFPTAALKTVTAP